MLKKLISILLGLTLIAIIMPTKAFAERNNYLSNNDIYVNGSDDIIISEPMTLDEMIKTTMKEENINYSEALELLGVSRANMFFRSVAFRVATYRTITSRFDVTGIYKPSLKFRCETTEGGGHVGIKKILNTSMDKRYNGLIKQFQGNVFVHLEDANRIYYSIDGNFHNNGTTTVSVDGGVEIGGIVNIGFSASDTSSHYAYIWTEKTIKYPY